MSSSRLVALALAAAALVAVAPATALAKPKPKPQYYLSLGDSLSVGVQPGPASDPGHESAIVNTSQGYTNQLYTLAKRRYPGLKLVAAGCGGATTESFISGGYDTTTKAPCNPLRKLPYASTSAKTSQLAYAESFLRKHRGHVAFVTIEIGNNDLDGCLAAGGGIDLQCVSEGTADIKRDLPVIGKRLRKAAGPRVPIVGATFYDPFLQSWFSGASGQGLAGASQSLAQGINQDTVIPAYQAAKIDVARIDEAFGSYTPLTQLDAQGVPVAVANICRYTWMCAPSPIGPNIHASAAGYALMAKTFLAELPRR